jgi:hypothetical protein
MCLNLSLTCGTKSLFHSLSEKDKIILIDRAPLASLANAHKDLLTAKGLCRSRTLDDIQECDLLS